MLAILLYKTGPDPPASFTSASEHTTWKEEKLFSPLCMTEQGRSANCQTLKACLRNSEQKKKKNSQQRLE
jgi:hypothetical protein